MNTFWAGRASRAVRLTASLVGLALLTAACGGADADSRGSDVNLTGEELVAAAKEECDSITWYASGDAEWVGRVSDSFEQEYGIRVNWTESGSGEVASRLATEARAGGSQADVVMGPISTMAALSDQEVFRSYNSTHVDDIDSMIVDSYADYKEFVSPVLLGTVGIIYNSNEVSPDEAPKSWKDLTEQRWLGEMAAADPRYGVLYASVIDFLAKTYGWGYVDKVGSGLRLARGGGDTQALLVTGEVDVLAYAGFSVAATAIQQGGAPIGIVVPEEGLLGYSNGSAVTEESQCPNGAKLLIDYMTGEKAQALLPEYGYYPARSGMAGPEALPALDAVKWQPTKWQDVANPDGYQEVVDRFEGAVK